MDSKILEIAASNNEFLLLIMTTSWYNLGIVLMTVIGGIIFHKITTRKLKHEKAELHRQVLERNELLTYSLENEKKWRENAEAETQGKIKLLARMNHDVRTPMNAVIGMTSLLSQTSLTQEQLEYTETIRSSGESLIDVINNILLDDILSCSKVDAGKGELQQKEFDLRNNIEEIIDVFAGKASEAGLELMYRIDSNVPAKIVGDQLRLRQVLMNLAENAIRFTRWGEIVIEVSSVSDDGAHSGELCFLVRDTGIGMSPEKLKEVAVRLSQSYSFSATDKTGGVGLIICANLVELMGGRITIESRPDHGTCVKFSMPTTACHSSRKNLHELMGQEGKRILIVDDNSTFRDILNQQISDWGLVPIAAGSGNEALAIAAAYNSIDVVITDRHMPEMDGIQLAQALKMKYPRLPIILLSLVSHDLHEKYGNLFHSVLERPVRQHLLGKHILSALTQKESENGNPKLKLSTDFAQKHPLRILVAEDNPLNLQLTKRVLGKLGYQPDAAKHGKEVLELVSNTRYDLILMDIEMPQMDGLETTRMIRLCLPDQPFILAMTANSLPGDRQKCLDAGMDDYISKPVPLEEFVSLLEKWDTRVKSKPRGDMEVPMI